MDVLAVEVSISKPTLYQYFNSKEDLVAQAVARMFAKMEAEISEFSDELPLARLEHFLGSALKAQLESHYRGTPGDVEAMRSIIWQNPELVTRLRATKDKLEKIVHQAQGLGEIDPAMPAWVVVNVLLSLQRAIALPLATGSDSRSAAELSLAVDSILRLFRRGVGQGLHEPA